MLLCDQEGNSLIITLLEVFALERGVTLTLKGTLIDGTKVVAIFTFTQQQSSLLILMQSGFFGFFEILGTHCPHVGCDSQEEEAWKDVGDQCADQGPLQVEESAEVTGHKAEQVGYHS